VTHAGLHPLPNVSEGEVLAGKYRIERVLGTGGMGHVVAATHIHLGERVAIKFLLPEVLENQEAVTRFMREAQAAVRIKSEHVARVTDVGTLDNGAPYMVMEYLEGTDLGDWLERRDLPPIEQTVEFVLQACEAIAEAHSLGIVHRDLKPANLFCIRRADGVQSIKVLDFGISKLTGSRAAGTNLDITRTAAIVGSPVYMSPEQLRASRDVDPRTDIWSLGVILFQLISGRVPFISDSLPDLSIRIVSDPTPHLRDFRPDVPEALEQVVEKCLEKKRERRYSDVAELAVALVPWAPKRARACAERVVRTVQAARLSANDPALEISSDDLVRTWPAQTYAAWGQTAPPRGLSRPRLVLALAAAGALLASAASFVWLKSRTASNSDHTQSVVPTVARSAGFSPMTGTTLGIPAQHELMPTPDDALALVPRDGHAAAEASTSARMVGKPHPATAKSAPPPNASAGTPKPAEKANCDPPYTLDEAGNKHFKPECFTR
jgi:eukaryotic-like serine/threonine-protein kinase